MKDSQGKSWFDVKQTINTGPKKLTNKFAQLPSPNLGLGLQAIEAPDL